MIKILYISTLCSDKLIKEMFEAGYKPIQAMQKFNSLLAKGMVVNGCRVYALTEIPKTVGPKIYRREKEMEDGVRFSYIPKIDVKLVYNLLVMISAFFRTLRWGVKNRKDEKVVIFDILQTEAGIGARLACRLLGIKSVAIVTDLPDLPGMLQGKKETVVHRYLRKTINRYANGFDGYVLLTEQMNEVVNRKGVPFIVMEGLCDSSMSDFPPFIKNGDNKVVIYAGGLYEEYGVKFLINGFLKLESKDVELHLFGHGPMVELIESLQLSDKRIKYFGIVPNSRVVQAELAASLLVNPRPTIEDFTKYSFPSKNMEYMVSGTPVLTTVLAGMPMEYHDYVYLLKDESENGVFKMLKKLLIDTPGEELELMGERAKRFVLDNKNNIYQSNRIIDFVKNN